MKNKYTQKTWQAIFLDEAKRIMGKDCSGLITITSELIAVEHKNLIGEIRKILRIHAHKNDEFYKNIISDIDELENKIKLP